VLFYDVTGCAIDVRQQLSARHSELSGRLEKLESPIKVDDRSCRRPRLHLIDSAAIEGETGYDLAVRLGRGSIQGYALLILDGWRTHIDQSFPVRHWGNGALAPGELIAESTLSVQQLIKIQLWAAEDGLPLLIGVSTATNNPISAATLAVDAALRDFPDRQVRLCRSQLFLGTDEWKRHPPHVATLTGDNPGAPNFRPAFQRKP
jgi:hypothetical protein